MNILKFGGASFGAFETLEALVSIAGREKHAVVVVSAFAGVTDLLIGAATAASKREPYAAALVALLERHKSVAAHFLPPEAAGEASSSIERELAELERYLRSVELLRDLSARVLDQIMGFGECLSSALVARILLSRGISASLIDARELIATDSAFGAARVLPAETAERVAAASSSGDFPPDGIAVVPGFIASTQDGVPTTLGRGGSDLTASILAVCLKASEIQIWSDSEGMYTADPSLVPDAFVIHGITCDEALEMTHFGAKVLNPTALPPAMEAGIPIRIRGFRDPDGEGTLISRTAARSAYPVRGVASIPSVSLLSVRGTGLAGVTGIAARMFAALAGEKINVILITQASSELSICCAVDPAEAERGARALAQEFAAEIAGGSVETPFAENAMSVIAVVGEQMRERTGIAGRVFSALGRNGVNVVAIAQGSSELNISIVTSARNRAKALAALHDAFFLAGIRTVNLFLAGTGLIGSTLLAQIADQREKLLRERSIRINLVGVADSKKMLVDPKGIDVRGWRRRLDAGERADFGAFVGRMRALNLPSACFCDCTASETPPERYREVFEASISVVTPNKRANAGPRERYASLKTMARDKDVVYGYETTVGAGLPVIGTLRDLVACGDAIARIEAVLSGTVSFIFNNLGGGRSFSSLVLEARERGYTEPDPRDDLGAVDIARKTLILIREAGFGLEYEDIAIQPLLPESLAKAPSVEQFLSRLPEADAEIGARAAAAAGRGKALRYVAVIEPGSASLALKEYGPESPFYNLSGTDNIVMFTTARYSENPLVVRGPGAGAAVTAGGVFADILKTAQSYL